MKLLFPFLTLVLLFTGCSVPNLTQEEKPKTQKEFIIEQVRAADYTKPYAITDSVYQNLNGAIVAMADQLFVSNTFRERKPSLILTSFVELNKLDKTTTFGRMLSESMFNELHIRNFHVTDFRGQNAVAVNADGEFHITRDVDKLKDHISATEYIVVGTFVKFEHDSVLLNARILDSENGSIISTARVIYTPDDCTVFDLCFDPVRPDDYGIDLVKDKAK
jgi:TolB-like protein